jgi:hypothetical protein
MQQHHSGLTRRAFLASAAVAGAVAPGAASAQGRPQPSPLAIDALRLEPAVRADLEAFAEPVLRDTAYLAELPLENVSPAFRFVPPGGDQ